MNSLTQPGRIPEGHRTRWILAIVIGLFLEVGTAGAWDRSDVLNAIHQVENPNDVLRFGSLGELGPFQLRPAVWLCYTEKPFLLAIDAEESQAVAEAHYDWLKRGLERNRMEVSPYSLGLAWNAGLMATVNNRAPEQSKNYAQRVANLVEVMEAERTPAAPPKPSETPKDEAAGPVPFTPAGSRAVLN